MCQNLFNGKSEVKSKLLTKAGAIETDEAKATTWINQQLKALGITLTTTT
jgi:hypothetical protein